MSNSHDEAILDILFKLHQKQEEILEYSEDLDFVEMIVSGNRSQDRKTPGYYLKYLKLRLKNNQAFLLDVVNTLPLDIGMTLTGHRQTW